MNEQLKALPNRYWEHPMCKAKHPVFDGWARTYPTCVLNPGHTGPHSTSYGKEW